jgi:hypothetical protein
MPEISPQPDVPPGGGGTEWRCGQSRHTNRWPPRPHQSRHIWGQFHHDGQRRGTHQPDHEIPLGRVVLTCLAVLSAAAAVIHFAAAADYFQGYWLFGLSMLVAAWLQAAWAVVAVIRPSRGLLQAGGRHRPEHRAGPGAAGGRVLATASGG